MFVVFKINYINQFVVLFFKPASVRLRMLFLGSCNAFNQSKVSDFFTLDNGLCFFTHVKNPAKSIKLLRGFEILVFDSC